MNSFANSMLGHWSGKLLLEYCPWSTPGCNLHCLASALCEVARAQEKTGLWQGLAVEQRREAGIYVVLGVASLVLVIIAFAWPFWS